MVQRQGLRAGTDLTYNIWRGSGTISRALHDIEYMKPDEDSGYYIAISLKTGVTALGETLEKSYSALIFKLYNYVRDAMNTPEDVVIGEEVSEELIEESLTSSRMPRDRQIRALRKGIDDFIDFHKGSKLILSKIGFDPTFFITTEDLEDTIMTINVVVDTLVAASK